VLRSVRVFSTAVLAALASCSRGAKTDTAPAEVAPLAAYAPQRIIVTPTIRVLASESDSLIRQFGSAAAVRRFFDGEVARVLRERAIGSNWIMPVELARAYDRNRTYASDPYNLAVEPVRAVKFLAGSKYGEPLSSQLRTMIALHEDGRLVLLPAALQVHGGRVALRVALLDPRYAEARWVGDIRSDSASLASRASLTQIAGRLADLFVAP
jgi:hypothetical protein